MSPKKLRLLFILFSLVACSSPRVASSPTNPASPSESPSQPHSPSPSPVISASTLTFPPPPPQPTVKASPAHSFGQVAVIERSRLPYSWREGCPVKVEDLRLLTVSYWGFDSEVHTGELVVVRGQTQKILSVMKRIFDARFPIEKMELVDVYEGSDDRSMGANNTSAFNCRPIESRPGVWSQHAYGRAIDINPVRNPHISSSGEVDPPNGAPYADRSKDAVGMIHSSGPVVKAFSAVGWGWGGYWSSSKDYQHFSPNGS